MLVLKANRHSFSWTGKTNIATQQVFLQKTSKLWTFALCLKFFEKKRKKRKLRLPKLKADSQGNRKNVH